MLRGPKEKGLKNDILKILIATFFLFIAGVLLNTHLEDRSKQQNIVDNGVKVLAKIYNKEQLRAKKNPSTTYLLHYEYITVNNRIYRGNFTVNELEYQEAKTSDYIYIIYNRLNPKQSVTEYEQKMGFTFTMKFLVPAIAFFILIVVSLYIIYSNSKKILIKSNGFRKIY